MSYNVPRSCPACGHDLEVQVLHCPNCDTTVTGSFAFDSFANLPADQMTFLQTFLRCRGNMKAVGSLMGMSYPTTRARLDALLASLGLQPIDDVDEPAAEPVVKKPGRRGRRPKAATAETVAE